MSTLLEIKDLSQHFNVFGGKLKVLDRINFSVNAGEKIGLVGETGAGKTTLMKAILNILPQPLSQIDSGSILFEGQDITHASKKNMAAIRGKGISMIFQDPTAALNPVFSIGSQFAPIIRNFSPDKKLSAKEINAKSVIPLKEVSLPDPERILHCYPLQLSGGMRQRVCIAMALAAQPKLLIADEPGTSLDVTIQAQVLKLLNGLVEQNNMAFIMITHSLGVVRETTTMLYVMYAGTIVERAPTKTLFENPLHPYTQGLLAAVPRLTGGGVSYGIPGRMPDYLHPPQGCRFHPRCSYKMPVCETRNPGEHLTDENHTVMCFRYQPTNM